MTSNSRVVLLVAGDASVLILSFLLMMRLAFLHTLSPTLYRLHTIPFFILGILWIIIFFIFDLYHPQSSRPNIPHLKKIFWAFSTSFILGIIFFYSIPSFGITPKTNLVLFTGLAISFFLVWRRLFYLIF